MKEFFETLSTEAQIVLLKFLEFLADSVAELAAVLSAVTGA